MELNSNQLYRLVERFPDFNHSYETISQKGYSVDYNIALAIPTGKKNYAWFTFYRDCDVCYIFDLNKEKKIIKSKRVLKEDHNPLGKGTILYGTTVIDSTTDIPYFVIEDMYYYKGIQLNQITFREKIYYMKAFMEDVQKCNCTIHFRMPVMWENMYTSQISSVIPVELVDTIGYQSHHIQYRTVDTICPNINVVVNSKIMDNNNNSPLPSTNIPEIIHIAKYTTDMFKPQYRQHTVFKVKADLQYDIYHLYAYGKGNSLEYYGIAYIQDYKTSVFMNSLFRTIRENTNLDYIEESDDEDDFQNVNYDKYVDLERTISMECIFHPKFKRWIPVKIAPDNSKIIHIARLVKNYAYS